jgi:ClpP class serine protease
MADEIRAARKTKRVEAHVAGMCASAGYWLASQADRVYATRGSQVGSIGVVSTLIDDRRRLEQAGIDVHYVASAEGKVGAGAPGKGVSHRDLNTVQAEVDAWHDRFINAVAVGRGVARDVAAKWGDAAIHFAEDAEAAGLIDGVRDEHAVMEALRARGRAAANNKERRGKMSTENERGAPAQAAVTQQPVAVTPTSARDLRDAYPEAVAQIERDAVASERARVCAIAAACEGQAPAVVAMGLGAIRTGQDATQALGAMLGAAAKVTATAAPASTTTVVMSPTIDQIRAAAAHPIGPAPSPPKRTLTDANREWSEMTKSQRAEYHNNPTLFRAAFMSDQEVI